MKLEFVVVGFIILLCALLVYHVRSSPLETSTPTPTITPVYNIISAAGKMQTQIDEVTKDYIKKIQTITDPTAIATENASYSEKVRKIKSDYETVIKTP